MRSEIEIAAHMDQTLDALGEDLTREGLRGTPRRWARMMMDLMTPEPFEFTTFEGEGYDEMIVQTGIPFYSLCEHHVIPFFGVAAVAYLPERRIVGLSKLSRCVQYYAAGLQNQERITMQIGKRLMEELNPKGVGVVLRARHLCMEMRGVKTPGAETITSFVTGAFRTNDSARTEFMTLKNGL